MIGSNIDTTDGLQPDTTPVACGMKTPRDENASLAHDSTAHKKSRWRVPLSTAAKKPLEPLPAAAEPNPGFSTDAAGTSVALSALASSESLSEQGSEPTAPLELLRLAASLQDPRSAAVLPIIKSDEADAVAQGSDRPFAVFGKTPRGFVARTVNSGRLGALALPAPQVPPPSPPQDLVKREQEEYAEEGVPSSPAPELKAAPAGLSSQLRRSSATFVAPTVSGGRPAAPALPIPSLPPPQDLVKREQDEDADHIRGSSATIPALEPPAAASFFSQLRRSSGVFGSTAIVKGEPLSAIAAQAPEAQAPEETISESELPAVPAVPPPVKARFAAKKNASGPVLISVQPPRPRPVIKRDDADDDGDDGGENGGDSSNGASGPCSYMSMSLGLSLGQGPSSLVRGSWGSSGKSRQDPDEPGALLLVSPRESHGDECPLVMVPWLAEKLRPHQVAGCQFIAQACLGCKMRPGLDVPLGEGCLLADDMGLGKTLQTVAVIYTFLTQGVKRKSPQADRAVVICPTSLVLNWRDEVAKWLGDRLRLVVVTSDMKKETIESQIHSFGACKKLLLLISYDTARIYAETLRPYGLDLLVCDEAHKVKNQKTALFKALYGFRSKARIMVTGTPIQNGLDEFYALIDFCMPSCLGSPKQFETAFGRAIQKARDLDATDVEIARGRAKSAAFVEIVQQQMLRRTNEVIAKYLPAKLDVIVFCAITHEQQELYKRACADARAKYEATSDGTKAAGPSPLKTLSTLKKVINDPEAALLPPADERAKRKIDPRAAVACNGKLQVMLRLLLEVKQASSDRFVLISNSTQILDIFEEVLTANSLSLIRLDGSLAANKRQERVDSFNNNPAVFAFLLSSKAGGCGINLIGANRLILFDPDWNPAVDAQALARVWRSGQQKSCYVYRFFAVGTMEEVCFERQCAKSGLADEIIDGEGGGRRFSSDDLSDLFNPQFESRSNFHDRSGCKCCQASFCGPCMPDANGMTHYRPGSKELTSADPCLARAACATGQVSLVFGKVTDAASRGFDALEPQALP